MTRLNPLVLLLAAAVVGLPSVLVHGPAAAAAPVTRTSAGPVAVAAAPAETPGRWRVEPSGPTTYAVSWRSPSRLPVGSDRPTVVAASGSADDLTVGPPTVSSDGRTVEALVRSTAPLRARDLDVVLSGDRLDEPGDDRVAGSAAAPARRPQAAPQRVAGLAVDPGVPGPLEVSTSNYRLDSVVLPGIEEPIEMVGHIVEPAPGQLSEAAPLVLFQHGRHSVCYDPARPRAYSDQWPCQAPFREIPSQLGYDYVQRLLASQGFVTVSIRVNGINAQDYRIPDAGAGARAAIIERHLDFWTRIAAKHQVDLQQVVLVGHSRGGEGVDRASIDIPLSAPYRVAGQVLIAPTDFASQTAPYVPTVTLLPYCDGDVFDLQGQKFTDVSRDLAADDTSLKSSVLIGGANHNFFNTEWTPGVAVAPADDDWFGEADKACGTEDPARLGDGEQRDVGATYVAGAVRLFTGERRLLPMYDGSSVDLPSIGRAMVLSHAIGGGRELRRPRSGTALSLPVGARTSFCRGVAAFSTELGACGQSIRFQVTPHWVSSYEDTPSRPFFQMTWDAIGQRGGMLLDDPLDLSAGRLELRTLVDPRVGSVELGVRLVDADGAAVTVTPEDGGRLPALPAGYAKIWAQSLIVDASELAGTTGVDLSRITEVGLVSRNDTGRIWVADLAAAPASLARVPQRRGPLLDLGTVEVTEGDGPGTASADIPFTVTGLDRPASVVVALAGSGRRESAILDLAPGQTSGSIPVSYQPDDLDTQPAVRRTSVRAYPVTGVMTDSYIGSSRVVDDDPTPRVRITPARRTVREGGSARLRIHLGSPVGYAFGVQARVVGGPRPDLRLSDLPRDFRREHFLPLEGDRRLAALRAYLGDAVIRRGRQDATIAVPIRDDRSRERREALTIQVVYRDDDGTRKVPRTVYVARSD